MRSGLPLSKLKQSKFPYPAIQPVCLRHRLFRLTAPYSVELKAPFLKKKFGRPMRIDIPEGMLTDGASIDELAALMVGGPTDPSNLIPGVIHDYLFCKDCTGDAALLTFDECNQVFCYIKISSINKFFRIFFYKIC